LPQTPQSTNFPYTTLFRSPVAPATLQDYIGKYGNKEISVKDSGLYYQRIGGSGAVLRATGKDKFALNADAQIIFARDASGVVTEDQKSTRLNSSHLVISYA